MIQMQLEHMILETVPLLETSPQQGSLEPTQHHTHPYYPGLEIRY